MGDEPLNRNATRPLSLNLWLVPAGKKKPPCGEEGANEGLGELLLNESLTTSSGALSFTAQF